MLLNVSNTTMAISVLLSTFLLLTPATRAEERISCDNPPGPPGEIFCPSGQLAACRVDGVRVDGFCFDRGNRTKDELGFSLLSRILGKELSKQPFASGEYDEALRNGRLILKDSVVTFTPISR